MRRGRLPARRWIAAAGPFAASLVGVLGFGALYRGFVAHSLAVALVGLAMALFGLDRAGRALAASILLAEARRGGGRPAAGAGAVCGDGTGRGREAGGGGAG